MLFLWRFLPLADDALRLSAMQLPVFLYHLLRGIGVAIDAEVAARVVHAYVFARHATAGQALPLVLHLFGREGGAAEVGSEEGVALG